MYTYKYEIAHQYTFEAPDDECAKDSVDCHLELICDNLGDQMFETTLISISHEDNKVYKSNIERALFAAPPIKRDNYISYQGEFNYLYTYAIARNFDFEAKDSAEAKEILNNNVEYMWGGLGVDVVATSLISISDQGTKFHEEQAAIVERLWNTKASSVSTSQIRSS